MTPDPHLSRRNGAELSEWPIVVVALGSAGSFFVSGVVLAFMTHNPYWLNRFGALIVASEGLIMAAELRQERRLHRLQSVIEARRGDPEFARDVAKAVKTAKTSVVRIGLMLAIFGEVVHGFGDVALGALFGFHAASH